MRQASRHWTIFVANGNEYTGAHFTTESDTAGLNHTCRPIRVLKAKAATVNRPVGSGELTWRNSKKLPASMQQLLVCGECLCADFDVNLQNYKVGIRSALWSTVLPKAPPKVEGYYGDCPFSCWWRKSGHPEYLFGGSGGIDDKWGQQKHNTMGLSERCYQGRSLRC